MRGLLTRAALAVALAAGSAGAAWAESKPNESRFDSRIRFVTFNAADVVKIDTLAGVATHIQLEDGENYVTHAFGDAQAWSFAMEKHHVFIKPTADKADTNLIIVTDRRTYTFDLAYHKAPPAPVIFQLSFHYPDTAAKKQAAAAEARTLESALSGPRGNANTNYSMAGNKAIAPLNVWDDGKFTYFKFPENRDVPAIYMVDADGRESIVNRNSTGTATDVVVMQKVAEKWRVRLGGQVLSIFNDKALSEADAPIATNRDSATGTRSPVVMRVVKGGDQ